MLRKSAHLLQRSSDARLRMSTYIIHRCVELCHCHLALPAHSDVNPRPPSEGNSGSVASLPRLYISGCGSFPTDVTQLALLMHSVRKQGPENTFKEKRNQDSEARVSHSALSRLEDTNCRFIAPAAGIFRVMFRGPFALRWSFDVRPSLCFCRRGGSLLFWRLLEVPLLYAVFPRSCKLSGRAADVVAIRD